jgi:hypothetical protein
MKKNISFLFTILFLSASSLFSQNMDEQITFFKTYGDTAENHFDQGYAILQTEDGGYIVAGEYSRHYVGAPMHYYGDVYILKTDEHGETIWTKIYGDPNIWEGAYSMDKSSGGGYIISAFRFDSQSYKLWIIKINSQGDSIWSKIYPVREGNCIKQTTDGGYVITGGFNDIYLLKIDNQGNTVWTKLYDHDSEREEGNYVQQNSDGGYIICGITEFPDARGLDIWIIKTDSKGDTLWTKAYGGDYIDEPHSIIETEDGGYFIAGAYTEEGELGFEAHIWLLRTDSKGDTILTKKINNGSWEDLGYSMKKTSDGGFIIAGETVYNNFDSDIYLIKLDEEGNYQWFSTIGCNLGRMGDEKHYRGIDIIETSDGGYTITGFEWIYIGWDEYMDLCLLKVNDKGQITDIDEIKTNNVLNYTLSQNYPNPFNPSTQIKFQIPERGLVTLTIYDLLGKEVKVLIKEEKNKGTYMVNWDGKDKYGRTVSSGIYLYRLQSGSMSLCKKMAFIK